VPPCIVRGAGNRPFVWQATGREIWVTFGSPSNLRPEHVRAPEVIICRDAAEPGSPADAGLLKAIARLWEGGIGVRVATPPDPDKHGFDFNDTLRRDGAGAVRAAVEAAVDPDPPYFKDRGVAPRQGVERHRHAIESWGRSAIGYTRAPKGDPPREMLSGAQGVGKTRSMLRVLASAHGLVSHAAFPTLEKADEVAADLSDLCGPDDPVVQVVRGRSAKGSHGDPMCRIHRQAEKLSQAGVSVRKVVCPACPFVMTVGTSSRKRRSIA
jgi:hypothetical protein